MAFFDSGESRDSNMKDFSEIDSRSMNLKDVILKGNSDSDIEELGSIRIVRRSKGMISGEVGVSSQGNISEGVTLSTLPRKPKKARRLQGFAQMRMNNNLDLL